ncbi:MAG: S8 family serine peptidase [Acidobacteriia bacterium]|nr:S8 family serine peptidase [Terriglobia bacterium]
MVQKSTKRTLTSSTKALTLMGAEAETKPEGIFFEELGVAVVESLPEEIHGLSAEAGTEASPILLVEPERFVYALAAPVLAPPPIEEGMQELAAPQPATPFEYLQGYRDAVDHLVAQVIDRNAVAEAALGVPTIGVWNQTQFTWGLQATRVHLSSYSGRGVRVAVLDTGMDLGHPDFAGRKITSQSFVAGQPVQDGHGHGTHCIGTSCGTRQPGQAPRYGIAFNADIYVGKVLSNQGQGTDGQILAGIDWAIKNKVAVISMSLGAPTTAGQPFSQVFEQVARRSLAAGTLIIAAAGNDSHRPQQLNPVSHPANCPSIMAVAALDQRLLVASFSNAGLNPNGGQVDIAGPGVAVRSSWPRPTLYNTISGTSMATPHVAGIAALLAEARPNTRGLALWALVTQHARHLSIPSRDVGTGLTQAP